MKQEKTARRTRNYACVVYPESAPENWQSILAEQFVPSFISPLHDSDIDPQNQPKKPHYHVMIMFDSVKTSEQAKEIFNLINGVGCEVVNSLRGYARYLCHLDNPDKAQYNTEDVTCFCGADYTGTIGLVTDKYKAIKEIMEWCMETHTRSYSELLLYCKDSRMDWFRVLCDNGTIVVKEFLKSVVWTESNPEKND